MKSSEAISKSYINIPLDVVATASSSTDASVGFCDAVSAPSAIAIDDVSTAGLLQLLSL